MDKRLICTFVTGLSIGAGIGLLFAPRSGKKTRTRIAEAAADGAAYAKEYGETVRDTTLDVIERSKEAVAEVVRGGAQAYKKAVG
jgi:gas vesicle protein